MNTKPFCREKLISLINLQPEWSQKNKRAQTIRNQKGDITGDYALVKLEDSMKKVSFQLTV